jgi:hypothetical protein
MKFGRRNEFTSVGVAAVLNATLRSVIIVSLILFLMVTTALLRAVC